MGSACMRMRGVRKACKSFINKHHHGKKSHHKNNDNHNGHQVDVDDNGDGDGDDHETDGLKSPKLTIPRFLRTASAGYFSSGSLKRTTSQRSKTPGRIRPVKNFLRSFSRKSSDTSSTNTLHVHSTRNNSTTILYSNANGLQKPLDTVKRLECTLEELCFGCIKKVNVKRDVLTNDGEIIQEDEVLTINVKPGWKKGTKVIFQGKGNETSPDITFVIEEKQHPFFKRNGNDLELAFELPLVDALSGCTITIPSLGGQESCLTIDNEVITPGYQKTIPGEGMTLLYEQEKRGNLNIKFSVLFPDNLTEEQRSECFQILQDSC